MPSPARTVLNPVSVVAENPFGQSVKHSVSSHLPDMPQAPLVEAANLSSEWNALPSPRNPVSSAALLPSQSQKFEKNRYRLGEDQFLPERHRKDLIVLHFTAGTSCESAYRTWAGNPDRIATAYGVDPDGAIVEFFPPEFWAFHLGVKGTRRHDQRSIGIEIANVGPLKLSPEDPKQLNWWPKDWGTRFCHLDEAERYCRARFRGIDYFAAMPVAQQEAVGLLVRHLCERFSIPAIASAEARRGEFNPAHFDNYSGVATHSNFRRDKWDVGPAFCWDRLGF